MNRRGIILAAFRDWRERPFAWDGACCLSWVGDVAGRLTGTDPTVALRARYTTEIGCRRGMVAEGWTSYGDAAASLLPEIPVSLAQAGDWALCVDPDGHEGLGVVCGSTVAVRAPAGMAQAPLDWARRAFRVA